MSNNSAATLPDIFVCFFAGYERPRRYMRMGEDSWEVCLWIGYSVALVCYRAKKYDLPKRR
jgi:hypothetical protein